MTRRSGSRRSEPTARPVSEPRGPAAARAVIPTWWLGRASGDGVSGRVQTPGQSGPLAAYPVRTTFPGFKIFSGSHAAFNRRIRPTVESPNSSASSGTL